MSVKMQGQRQELNTGSVPRTASEAREERWPDHAKVVPGTISFQDDLTRPVPAAWNGKKV